MVPLLILLAASSAIHPFTRQTYAIMAERSPADLGESTGSESCLKQGEEKNSGRSEAHDQCTAGEAQNTSMVTATGGSGGGGVDQCANESKIIQKKESEQEKMEEESEQEKLKMEKESEQEKMKKESEQEKMGKESKQEKMGKESEQEKIGKESEQEKMGKESEQEKMGEKEQEEVKVKRKKKDGGKVPSTKPKKVKGDDIILKELEKFRYAFNKGVCVPESQCPVITCILLLTHYFLFFRRKVT